MRRLKRRAAAHAEAADLDVTPFMNLMIVLVPVLLLSMVFTHTTVIDLNFPSGAAADGEFDPEQVHLEVVVAASELRIADGRGGVIKRLPLVDGDYDFNQLTQVMQELKRRMPEKEDITVLLEESTDYQTLVTVMDRVRSYPTVQGVDVVQAELFPIISLGDTPEEAGADVAELETATNQGQGTAAATPVSPVRKGRQEQS
ncbi:MAG: biopolymer transporter ExbD [Pseudomonadota bacterium]